MILILMVDGHLEEVGEECLMGMEALYCSLLIKEGRHGVSLGEQDLTKDLEVDITKDHLPKDLGEVITKDRRDSTKDQVGLIKDLVEEVTIKDLIKDQELGTIKDQEEEEDLTKDQEVGLIKEQEEEEDIIRDLEE